MEFKKKLVKRRKAAKARNRKEKGMIRVKIRGRKRWVRAKKARAA